MNDYSYVKYVIVGSMRIMEKRGIHNYLYSFKKDTVSDQKIFCTKVLSLSWFPLDDSSDDFHQFLAVRKICCISVNNMAINFTDTNLCTVLLCINIFFLISAIY